MKLKVLVDNNTIIGNDYLGEPGLSFFIEEDGRKMLLDVGCSDVFIRNARKMGIDINDIDMIVLSHGHYDHTWGLTHLMENLKPSAYIENKNKITVITHPLALCPKAEGNEPIGLLHSESVLNMCFDMKLSEKPLWISEKLVYLGRIDRSNDFENKNPIGTTFINGSEVDDYVLDDSALVYKSQKGLVVITGCSHSGICNIVEQAKKVCKEERIFDIIGGFHLLGPSKELLDSTLEYMKELKPRQVHACHCTDLYSKIALSKVVEVVETGVGLFLEYE